MDKKYNDCDITLELLPLYIEKRTCKESDAFVENHILQCTECETAHIFMSRELEDSMTDIRMTVDKKQQWKKRRIRARVRKILILSAGVIGYMGLMYGIIMLVFKYLTGV